MVLRDLLPPLSCFAFYYREGNSSLVKIKFNTSVSIKSAKKPWLVLQHASRLILTVAKLLAGMFCFLSSPLSFCSCKEASCTETRFKI